MATEVRAPGLELWSSLVEGDEGLDISNCQTNKVNVLHIIDTTVYQIRLNQDFVSFC